VNCVDNVAAPANYDEFFRDWRPFVVNLCRRFGISEDAKESIRWRNAQRLFGMSI